MTAESADFLYQRQYSGNASPSVAGMIGLSLVDVRLQIGGQLR
jgi:hypothetical protein